MGAPGWSASERFDIEANPVVPVARTPERLMMLQGLLRGRFGLVMRAQPVDVKKGPLGALRVSSLPAPRHARGRIEFPGAVAAVDAEMRRRLQRIVPPTDRIRQLFPHHVLKECGGRVEEAAARLGARERAWRHRQRQRLGIESTVPTDIESSERTAAGA